MKQERCIILIDGSNFYFKLKDLALSHLLDFDFSSFAKTLCREQKMVKAVYHIGKVRTDGTEKANRLLANQQRLFAHLRGHGVFYSLGYLLKSGGAFHEKGVDVNIAVDMLVATYENVCDRIYLISSDTDLLPAIKKAKEKGKIVTYVGFSHQPSVAMVATCSEARLLTKEDLLPFLHPSQTKKQVA
jgi:uncharacterized LabA/DUF88 family protein